jgi:hypothetical protein
VNQMGTKLVCDQCQAQVIVTKAGSGTVMCHDAPMQVAGGPRPAGLAQGASGQK